jgi:hypothetical protein
MLNTMLGLPTSLTKMLPNRSPAKFPTITIAVAGEQVLSSELPQGRYTIGGSSLADFCLPMLDDDQLCTIECVVEQGNDIINLSDISPQLFINGKRSRDKTASIALNDVLRLTVDEVVIEVRSQRVKRNLMPYVLFGGAVVLLVAGWVVGNPPPQPGLAPMQAVSSAAGVPLLTKEAVITELNHRLGQADLASRLTVHDETRGVVIKGQLARNLTSPWRELLMQIRQRAQVPVIAEINPIPAEASGRHDVAGVLVEPRRLVVARNGKTFMDGEELPSGWRIESISLGNVRLSRDGLIDDLNLPGPAAMTDAGG